MFSENCKLKSQCYTSTNLLEWLKLFLKADNVKCWEMALLESLYITTGNVKWYNYSEKQLVVF